MDEHAPAPTGAPPASATAGDGDGCDPRVARSRAAIIDAAVALLREGGIHATTVDAIAERAGVSKATVYRHWDSRRELILDALITLKPVPTPPETGSLRDDMVALTTELARHLASPAASALFSMSAAAEYDPDLAALRRDVATTQGSPLRGMVAAAIDRGELPADLDVDAFVATVVGPFFYVRLTRGEDVPAHWPEAIVDAALAAQAPDAGRRRPSGAD